MTFGMTLAEQLTKAASASMFYFAIDYENEPNMKVGANNVNIKIWCPRGHYTAENLRGT